MRDNFFYKIRFHCLQKHKIMKTIPLWVIFFSNKPLLSALLIFSCSERNYCFKNMIFRYLDTIDSDTGVLNTMSALNLIVFGPKLEHLDLIEYVVVDLLKVKWNSFVRREFFIQMAIFAFFFAISKFTIFYSNLISLHCLGMFVYLVRPIPSGVCISEVKLLKILDT